MEVSPSGTAKDRLRMARRAYEERDWVAAHDSLEAAGAEGDLAPDDLVLLSTSAYMVGDVAGMIEALEDAYEGFGRAGRYPEAARCALWLAANLAARNKMPEAGGWVERGRASLDLFDGPTAEDGFLLLPEMLRLVAAGELEEAVAVAAEAVEIGRRFDDRDLIALAGHTRGRALMVMGRAEQGLHAMDDVMLSVVGRECSPMVTGTVYCAVIEDCFDVMEIRRASRWTESLSEWCGSQTGLVAFTDRCLAHRAEVMRLRGEWDEALAESRRSLDNGARGGIAAQARYQMAEIHRLRGEYALAEEAYGDVSVRGGEAQPGLALLRLAQGNGDAAAASVRRALEEAVGPVPMLRVLPGFVEVMIGAGSLTEAGDAVAQLRRIADSTGIDTHVAWADHATGMVELARGEALEAARSLKSATIGWDLLAVPYELAASRAALARAYLQVGDADAAASLIDAASATFRALGAFPDLRRLDSLRSGDGGHAFGLTDREVEVLRLLTGGSTNREIAGELVLSERTIDRHVSNIFTKMGVNTRAAATARAIREEVV